MALLSENHREDEEYTLAENSEDLLSFYDEVSSFQDLEEYSEPDMSHLEDIEDGAGCVLTWEYLSENRDQNSAD